MLDLYFPISAKKGYDFWEPEKKVSNSLWFDVIDLIGSWSQMALRCNRCEHVDLHVITMKWNEMDSDKNWVCDKLAFLDYHAIICLLNDIFR